MRTVVLGAGGIVGRATLAEARRRGWEATGFPREELDIRDGAAVRAAIEATAPGLVVNAAAFTRVDDCETETALAREVNGIAPGLVARACAASGARLVHLSSDYVFAGDREEPYDEGDEPAPLSAYGRSKLEGERQVLASGAEAIVVRTSALFGAGGPNFVDTIARLLRSGEGPLRVVDDQVTAPTWAPFLARAVLDLGESTVRGCVHYRNREPVSWYELARAIAAELGSPLEIVPVPTSEMPRPARRPARSVLAVKRFEREIERRVEAWPEGLRRHLETAREEIP